MKRSIAAKPSGVTIRVSITDRDVSGQSVRHVEIADDGAGMSEATLVKTFEPFFTTKQTGTGLGLPICERILDAHGGEISIRSIPQTGTMVVLKLPIP